MGRGRACPYGIVATTTVLWSKSGENVYRGIDSECVTAAQSKQEGKGTSEDLWLQAGVLTLREVRHSLQKDRRNFNKKTQVHVVASYRGLLRGDNKLLRRVSEKKKKTMRSGMVSMKTNSVLYKKQKIEIIDRVSKRKHDIKVRMKIGEASVPYGEVCEKNYGEKGMGLKGSRRGRTLEGEIVMGPVGD